MESQPKNPEFRNNPENFYPCSKISERHLGVGSVIFEKNNALGFMAKI